MGLRVRCTRLAARARFRHAARAAESPAVSRATFGLTGEGSWRRDAWEAPSDNKTVAAYARCARSGEHGSHSEPASATENVSWHEPGISRRRAVLRLRRGKGDE